jgi:hypothetical protein
MGVMALDLISQSSLQRDLFDINNYEKEEQRNETILKLMDYYNQSGKSKIQFAKNIQLPQKHLVSQTISFIETIYHRYKRNSNCLCLIIIFISNLRNNEKDL